MSFWRRNIAVLFSLFIFSGILFSTQFSLTHYHGTALQKSLITESHSSEGTEKDIVCEIASIQQIHSNDFPVVLNAGFLSGMLPALPVGRVLSSFRLLSAGRAPPSVLS